MEDHLYSPLPANATSEEIRAFIQDGIQEMEIFRDELNPRLPTTGVVNMGAAPPWPPERELRMRCIEAAARLMRDAGFDAQSREQHVMDSAKRFLEWVMDGGAA